MRNVPPRGSNYRRRIRPGLSAFRLPFPPNRYSFPIQGMDLYPHTRMLPCSTTEGIIPLHLFGLVSCFFQKDEIKCTLVVQNLETHRNALLASLGFTFLNSFWLTAGLSARHHHIHLLHCVVPEFTHQCGLLLMIRFCCPMPIPPKLMTCHLTGIIIV